MLDDMLFFELAIRGGPVIFRDNHGKIAAGIAEDRGAVHALNSFHQERTAAAGSIL
jgi:hypothetical protein